jgi:hypothetical protein
MVVSVNVRLDRFGREALEEHLRGSGATGADALDDAVRYYLGDSGSGRVAWRAPRHYGRLEAGEELELELDEDLHGQLQREARRQRVTPELLAVHALMYYLADLDSGRAAARLGDAMNRDAEAK